MPAKKLTYKYITSVVGVPGDSEIRDFYSLGLRIILRPTSRHVWAFRRSLNGTMRKLTLGPISEHTLEEARQWAIQQSRCFDRGIDPIHEKNTLEVAQRLRNLRTCNWLFDQYMQSEGSKVKTANQKWSMYNTNIKPIIGEKSYFDISHSDLSSIAYAKYQYAPTMANRIVSLMQRWFNWSTKNGLHITELIVNPAANLTKFAKENTRSRAFDDLEIEIFLKSLAQSDTPFRDPLLVSIHTGARRGEVFGMRWSEININCSEWLIPRQRTKNGLELLLPLPPVIVDILSKLEGRKTGRSDLVWPSKSSPDRPMSGFSRIITSLNVAMSKDAYKRGLTIDEWCIHNLRRTLITGMNGLLDNNDHPLIPPHVIERIVNHKLPGQQFIYNRHQYYAEKKAALRIWASHLSVLGNR